MGGTHWSDLSGKKRWKKAHADQKNKLYQIARRYHLTKDTKPSWIQNHTPYVTFESFEYDAKNYADHKYAHTAYVSGWSGKVVAVTLSIVVAVVSVLVAPATGGSSLYTAMMAGSVSTSTALALMGTSVALSLGGLALATSINNKRQAKELEKSRIQQASVSQEFKQQAKQRSDTLTTLMIYGGYEIYANKSIYNQGRAGDSLDTNTFSPTQSYDPTKGMRGDLQKDTHIDDVLQYRSQVNLAGGRDFLQKTLGVQFPLYKSEYDYNMHNEVTQKSMNTRLSEINEGFGELIDAGAGLVVTHSLERTSNPPKAYTDIIELELGFFKAKLSTNDFLQKLERYKNEQWADFMYLYFKDATKQKDSAMKNAITLIQNWDSQESQEFRSQMSDEELLKTCIEMMMYSLEVAVNFLSEAEIYQDTYYLTTKDYWQYFFKKQNGAGTIIQNYFASFNPESANTPKDIKALHTRLTQLIHQTINNNIKIAQEAEQYRYKGGLHYEGTGVLFEVYPCILEYTIHEEQTDWGFLGIINFKGVKDEINPQLLQSLTKSFWDNRLDDLDLSIYTLEELGLI